MKFDAAASTGDQPANIPAANAAALLHVLPKAGFMNLRNRTVPRASNASSGNRRFRTS